MAMLGVMGGVPARLMARLCRTQSGTVLHLPHDIPPQTQPAPQSWLHDIDAKGRRMSKVAKRFAWPSSRPRRRHPWLTKAMLTVSDRLTSASRKPAAAAAALLGATSHATCQMTSRMAATRP